MKNLQRLGLAAISGLMLVSADAVAGDFGKAPTDYKASTMDYLESRMSHSRGLRVQFRSAPYRAYADIGRHKDMPVWAVDVRVRMPMARSRGADTYTVILMGDTPVALERDEVKLRRA